MKKFLSIFAIITLLFSLAACQSSKATEGKAQPSKKNVTISFASWTLGTEQEQNLERLMIKEFENKYPYIKVKIDDSISTKDWNGSLTTAASAGKMPDVFALPQIPLAVQNDWLLDITKMASQDKDFSNISKSVIDSATFNKKIVAVPYAQHFLGYWVNKDLFNNANLDVPEYGMSLDQFKTAVKEVTDINKGIAGLNNPFSIPDWYPIAANKDMGYFTYKNGSYSLDSNEFISGVNFAKEIMTNNYAYETLKDDQKAKFKGKDPETVWLQGGVALKWDGTWSIPKDASFDYDFIGIPGGKTVVTNDFVGISKSTKNPKEAFLFTKWMSFSKEGFMKRLELAQKDNKPLNTLPITNDKQILDKYFKLNNIPGIREAFKSIDQAVTEPVKTIPGYVDVRWTAPTGVKAGQNANATTGQLIDSAVKGDIKIEDYAKQLNVLANNKSKEAFAAINK
jgi:multiple sugar transport system substrate-binding protein